jgi:sugar lactone lactonase YvrE
VAWVDIHQGVALWKDAGGGGELSRFPEKISAVIPVASGGYLYTGERRLWRTAAEGGPPEIVAELAAEPASNRCNDAKCDPWGNLWFGTVDDAERVRSGALWCLGKDGRLRRLLHDIGVSNTLAWDQRRGLMYFGDSMRRVIWSFEVRGTEQAPELGEAVPLPGSAKAPGSPDGSAIDVDGCLWNARWDGGCIVRLSPDGHLLETRRLPVQRPTSCCFGGVGLQQLFVTSAAGDGEFDGHVLQLEVEVAGSPVAAFGGAGVSIVDTAPSRSVTLLPQLEKVA